MSLITLLPADAVPQAVQDERSLLVDARSAQAYWAGHLPGARHLDPALLALSRTDAASLGAFDTLLTALLSQLGARADSRILVYGQKLDTEAARIAWALAYAGHADIAVVDGGLDALATQQPALQLSTEAPAVRATPYQPAFRRALLATAEQIRSGLPEGAQQLLDAREAADYRGEKSSAARFGHIPGARHWDVGVELAEGGRLAAPAALHARLEAAGVSADQPVVLYCGGGGRAARSFLALSAAGHEQVAVYPASWREWGNRDDLPLETAAPAVPA